LAQEAPKAAPPKDAGPTQAAAVFLQGTVKDHLKLQPVNSVRVELRDPARDQVLADTETDAEGKFFLASQALPPGKYVIRVSLTNYRSETQEITIEANSKPIEPISFVLTCKQVEGAPMRHSVVRVFYATDRREGRATLKWTDRLSYQNVRDPQGKLSLGICDVSIPETHQPTGIEKPSIWKFEFRPNPDKHLIVQSVQPETKDAFFKQVSSQVAASEAKDAFVFVHGYGLSFESAVQRTAQLAYDLGFHGAPILYSWASEASWLGYLADQESVKLTVDDLRSFLQDVAQRSGARNVHLIAHSMGSRALLAALLQVQGESAKTAASSPFRDVVFAAPDVDRSEFIQAARKLNQPNRRMTLYVSSSDQALLVSQKLFHHEARAGEAGRDLIVLPGVDTIDVTRTNVDTLGHSYYGNNRPVVRDLSQIFDNYGTPRQGLAQAFAGPLVYWLLTPSN
jgi:esterase/lipase superfamily enzyme